MHTGVVFGALLVALVNCAADGASYCGSTLTAAGSCQTACPRGLDQDCPAGQTCHSQVTCSDEVGRSLRAGKRRGANNYAPVSARRILADDMCVTAGCASDDTCTATELDDKLLCPTPDSFVCEHEWDGVNVCQSPPLLTMLPCWMSSVDGSLALNEISIPGTHDTMAKGSSACFQAGVGDYIFTQTWSLRTMLDAGIRALDIRLRHQNDDFVLEHGIVELPYSFEPDVRDVLETFLAENPSETVIMFYQVNDLGPNTRTWQETLQASLNETPELWLGGTTIPTLDEARGKIVLGNSMPRVEQNEYSLNWDTFGDKKDLIRAFFEDGQPQDQVFRLNYLSGTGLLMLPMTVAAGIPYIFPGTNEIVLDYSGGCLGITMMDYIGEDAISHIVAQQGTTAPTRI